MIAALATDAKLTAQLFDTDGAKEDAAYPFRNKSSWVALARDAADLETLTEGFDRTTPSSWGRWRALRSRRNVRVWTDDYSNIITLLR